MTPQTLYFLRHAETVTGSKGFFGSTDVDLSDAGKLAAAQLPAHWHGAIPQVIYTSDRLRARLSAAPLSEKLGLQARVDARLNEMDFGVWEGLGWREIERAYPEIASRWSEDWVSQRVPDGESFSVVHERTRQVLRQLLYECSDCPVMLIVAHAGSIRAMICELLGRPLQTAFDAPLDYLHRCELQNSADAGWQLVASNVGFGEDR